MPGKYESDWGDLGQALGGEIGTFYGSKSGASGGWAGGEFGGRVGRAIGEAIGAAADSVHFGDVEIPEPGSGEGDPGPGMSGPEGGQSVDPGTGEDPPPPGDGGGDNQSHDSGYDGEDDGVGDNSGLEERLAGAIARGLAAGGIPTVGDGGDGDGTGRIVQDRMVRAITGVLVRHVQKSNDAEDGNGQDVVGIDSSRVEALVTQALARGAITPRPDDSGDGDGTGRPIPALGRISIGL